jgi:hypothetical protein
MTSETQTPTPTNPSSDADTAPISPISKDARVQSFPHHTLAAAAIHPFIDTATPAINNAPVELDGTPTSPVTARDDMDEAGEGEGKDTGVSTANAGAGAGGRKGRRRMVGGAKKGESGEGEDEVDDDDDDDEMFSPLDGGEDEVTGELREVSDSWRVYEMS